MKKVPGPKTLIAALAAALTFAVFSPALRNEFVNWDDKQYVYNNPFIQSLDINLLKSAFLGFYASNWHPLTWISHALDYAIWGLNPFGHHLTNNIIHAANTFLVVLLMTRLIETARSGLSSSPSHDFSPFALHDSRFTLIIAGVTGLLFGLHPLHVESVAWIAERKDLLCAFFFLLSVISYLKYAGGSSVSFPLAWNPPEAILNTEKDAGQAGMTRQVKRLLRGPYILSLLFFVLALLSKPMAVSLPFVLLIMDWYPFARIRSIKTFRTALTEKLPFLALSLGSSILTVMAQRAGDAITPTDEVAMSTRVLVASRSLIEYLWKMIMPTNLVPFYSYPGDAAFSSPAYFLPILLIIAATVICILLIKKHKLALSVWAYYVVTLIPVLGIVQIGGQSMADRYTYLPSIGPFLMIALLFGWAYGAAKSLKWMKASGLFAGVVASCLFAAMAYLTVDQTRKWKDSVTLWSCVIENDPYGATLAYYNRGVFFYEKGMLDKALADFNATIALNPFHYRGYNARGIIMKNQGRYKEALEDFDRVVFLKPSDYAGYYNRAGVYEELGLHDKAAEDFKSATELKGQ